MAADMFIVGDWGTSNLRLYLCRRGEGGAPQVLETQRGSGIKAGGDFEAVLFDTAAPWRAEHGPLPIVLGGMVGSTIGWRDVPYAACPAGAAEIAAGALRFTLRDSPIAIAPGLRCTNIFGLPDVMRGEEVQMLGFLGRPQHDARAQHLFCLPGTHAKWAFSRNSAITGFFTSMQGELHEIMLAHSVLGRTIGDSVTNFDAAGYADGLRRMREDPTLSLEHALFSVRSRIVLGDLTAEAGAGYLAGLLVGADVRDALAACTARDLGFHGIVLIGSERLVGLYAQALATMEQAVPVERMIDQDASVAGLAALLAQ